MTTMFGHSSRHSSTPKATRRVHSSRFTIGGIALLALFLSASAAYSQSLPDGWSVQGENEGASFAPERMNQGERLEIWIAPPQRLTNGGSLQSQLPLIRQQVGATGGNNCQQPAMISSGAAAQICEQSNAVVQYLLLPPRRGDTTAQLVRIVVAGNEVLTRYQAGIQQTMNIAMRGEAEKVLRRYGKSEQQLERERIAQAIRTAPGQGVSSRDIRDFFVAWEDRPIAGSTMRQVVHTAYLMFNDGTAYEDLDFPPDQFNAAASRQLQPQQWVTWRRDGDGYAVREVKGDWKKLQGWQALPARDDERLNGTYSRSSGSGDIYAGVSTSSSSWTFYSDGRFETSSYGTTGTGSMQAANGFSSSSSTLSNADGTRSSTGISTTGTNDPNANPVVSGGIVGRTGDGGANRGRYRLNGWVMEILRDNGQYERLLISFQSASRDVIDVDGRPFRRH
ncbi:hypothetical protein [Aquamicrobium sp.]|uniref:hypothetical protein n=1 Tax=Aquamicrobium sp. TaxID=1872579 RepID=UPI00258E7500|nr:hypothetical protein [Aquamicrobium sp.]MCK9549245.1 hypothetical protein [Aquamicrobium sp.]